MTPENLHKLITQRSRLYQMIAEIETELAPLTLSQRRCRWDLTHRLNARRAELANVVALLNTASEGVAELEANPQ